MGDPKVFHCKILNYQRVKQADLEFIPGLNIIVGESNNGKSSCIRAIETAIFNIPRESHVTLGETKSAVGISYNGHEVIWRRDTTAQSQVSYRVDGKIYQKLGRGQPEVVKEALNISEITINDRKFKVNFAKQMAYPFLLDCTPSELFKFIIQSSEEDNLVEVLRAMTSDVKQIAINVKSCEESRDELGKAYQRQVASYKAKKQVIPICNKVIELDSKVKKLRELEELVQQYYRSEGFLNDSERQLSKKNIVKEKVEGIVDRLQELKSKQEVLFSQVQSREQIENDLSDTEERLQNSYNRKEQLSDVETVIKRLDKLDSVRKERVTFESLWNEYSNRRKEVIDAEDELQNKVNRVDRILGVEEKIITRIKKLEELEEKIKTVEEYKIRYSDLQDEIKSNEEKLEDIKKSVVNIDKEIENIGVCPYCGSKLTKE